MAKKKKEVVVDVVTNNEGKEKPKVEKVLEELVEEVENTNDKTIEKEKPEFFTAIMLSPKGKRNEIISTNIGMYEAKGWKQVGRKTR